MRLLRTAAGIGIVVSACASEHGMRRTPGVDVSLDPGLRVEASWLDCDYAVQNLTVGTSVEGDGTLRIDMAPRTAYAGDTVTLRLSKEFNGELQVAVEASWFTDCGPDFGGPVENLRGTVRIRSANWSTDQPLELAFMLDGAAGKGHDTIKGAIRYAPK